MTNVASLIDRLKKFSMKVPPPDFSLMLETINALATVEHNAERSDLVVMVDVDGVQYATQQEVAWEIERLRNQCNGEQSFFLDRDNDGHWYIVDNQRRSEWEAFLAIPSNDCASWNVPDYARPVGGAPNTVAFSMVKVAR